MSCPSTFVGWLRLVLVSTLLMGGMTKSVRRSTDCTSIECYTICDEDDDEKFRPQVCGDCCPNGRGDGKEKNTSDRLSAMESSVAELRVMTGVLLALVLLLVLAVIILFLHLTKMLPRKFELPASFRNKKDNSDAKKKETSPHTNCNGVTANTTVSRLANHQSNSSPQNKRTSFTRSTSLGNTDLEPQPRPFRVRQPSESTCPEEGNDITPPQGYDNLALSTSTIDTSTLHNTSSDTLGPTLSTNTLHTTLSSDPQLIANTRHNTRV